MSKVIVDEIQTDTTNGNVRVIPNGTGALEVKGAGGDDAILQLNCSAQSHGVKLKSPAHSAGQSYTMILPDNQIAADKVLKVKSITGSGATAVGQLEFGDVAAGITVQEEGSALSTAATTLNFVGSSVTASGTGATKTITISGGGGLSSDSNENTLGGTDAGSNLDLSHTYPSDENTLIGFKSGENLIDGHGNTCLGWKTIMNYDCTGNTAIGKRNLWNVQNNYNTAIGYLVGGNTTTGDYNTYCGAYISGGTTGSNNLFLGYKAGTTTSPSGTISTGSNNVVLGNNSITNLYCADTSISSSDSRDKTDVTDFTKGLEWIEALRPVTYRWDRRTWYGTEEEPYGTPDGSKKRQRLHIGFLAQEALAVEQANGYGNSNDDSLILNLTDDGMSYGMKYERLVPILVNAIKELSTRVKTLEGG